MAYKSDYYEWEKDQKKGLSSKGKGKVASELSKLADLGKKAVGQEHLIAARSAAIANTPGVKKGGSLDPSMSTVDPTRKDEVESESPIFSVENKEYEQLKADMFGKKKKNGKKT